MKSSWRERGSRKEDALSAEKNSLIATLLILMTAHVRICVLVVAWLIIGFRVFENAAMPFCTRLNYPFVHPVGEQTFSSLLPSIGLSLRDIVYRDKNLWCRFGMHLQPMCNSRSGTFAPLSYISFIISFAPLYRDKEYAIKFLYRKIWHGLISFNFELNTVLICNFYFEKFKKEFLWIWAIWTQYFSKNNVM